MNDQNTARCKRHLFFSVGGVAVIAAVISASVIITSHAAKPIAVKKITVSPVALSLQVGVTAKVSVKIEPSNATDKTLTWVCADTRIATVTNDGKVTGKSDGTTLVRAMDKSGSEKGYSIIVVAPKDANGIAENSYQEARESIYSSTISVNEK